MNNTEMTQDNIQILILPVFVLKLLAPHQRRSQSVVSNSSRW